jgi:hypothetical protein
MNGKLERAPSLEEASLATMVCFKMEIVLFFQKFEKLVMPFANKMNTIPIEDDFYNL